ncbi:MAG: KpsF/GutQ family sugar-phosphate isomerase [Lachnospiraceae bacterium]|nr:KpsF/GutQ family sugar-phosphate isomerase [Lachnospiraceae bacterium]
MDKLNEAKRVFDIEIEALKKTRESLDDTFLSILDTITTCEGKVIVTGMGKPGHIATKIAATFSSLGTPSFCLHPAEAMHGDLGMISEKDVVVAISYSGESDEIIRILPSIKMIGARIIALTGNSNSTLAKSADIVQVFPEFSEACYLGLAPTSSTTVELVYGDALAVVASAVYGFKDADFGRFHPAGSIGKKLVLKVSDLMATGEKNSLIRDNGSIKDAIVELSKKGLGIVSIINEEKELQGIITDGDLRRLLENEVNVYSLNVEETMTKNPITISSDKLAVEAMNIMKKRNVSCLPIVDDGILVGTIRLQDIIGVGIV